MKFEDAKKHQVRNNQVAHRTAAARSGSVRGRRRRTTRMPPSETTAGTSIQSLSLPNMPLRKRPGPGGTATVSGVPLLCLTGAAAALHPV